MTAIRILEPSGSNGSIQIQNGGEFDHSSDLFFDIDNSRLGVGTTTPSATLHVVGDATIEGVLTVNEYKTNVVTTLHQEGSSEFGDTPDDTHTFTGPGIFNTGLSGSLTTLTDGSSYIVAGDGMLVSSGVNGSITITATHTVDGSTIIGPAEEGTYTDGLFPDFTATTTTGTAVDRFNEILKALAPSPPPDVGNIDCNTSGPACRLTYDASNIFLSYASVGTSTGFVPTNVNDIFKNSAAGQNLRMGTFDNNTTMIGDINESTQADAHSSGVINYPNNSFGNADQGTLKLVLNSVIVHSIELDDLFLGSGVPGSGTESDLNSFGTGFIDISQTDTASFADGTELDLFRHRTARYSIDPDDQRDGWNVLKVIHTISEVDNVTNTVEWLVDSDTTQLVALPSSFTSVNFTGMKLISGVKYYTGGTAIYNVDVENAYRNVYTSDNWVTFTDTNCSVPLFAIPEIDLSIGEGQDKIISIVSQATINADKLLNESFSVAFNMTHPIKNNIVSGSPSTVDNILLYNKADTSSHTSETFLGESYRVISGDYMLQTDVTSSNYWDSSASLLSNNGMLVYNESLISPTNVSVHSGDFTSVANSPADNVNYSTITTGVRTYYRRIQNTSGGSQTDLSIVIDGSGAIVQQGGSYGVTEISVSAKIPRTNDLQETGWLDLSQPFATGQYTDTDGCLQGSLDSTLNANNTMTFGTKFINSGEYIIIKIECDASFTGQVDSITVDWG